MKYIVFYDSYNPANGKTERRYYTGENKFIEGETYIGFSNNENNAFKFKSRKAAEQAIEDFKKISVFDYSVKYQVQSC